MDITIKYSIALVVVALCMYTDIKYGKIKNIFSVVLIISSIIILIVFRETDIKEKILGLIVPFVLGFPLYALRMFGAGDIKLFCSLGFMFGLNWILWCMAYSIFFGGAIALFIIIKSKNAKERLYYLFSYIKFTILTLRFTPYQNFEKNSTSTFPFAIAIFFGCVIKMSLQFVK